MTASYFMKKNRHSWRLNGRSKKFLNQWKSIGFKFQVNQIKFKKQFKESACKSKQVQGGKLFHLARAKFNFHMWLQGEICPCKPGSCNHHLNEKVQFALGKKLFYVYIILRVINQANDKYLQKTYYLQYIFTLFNQW